MFIASSYRLFWGDGHTPCLAGSGDLIYLTKGSLFTHTHTQFLVCINQTTSRERRVDVVIVISKRCRHSDSYAIARDFGLVFLQRKVISGEKNISPCRIFGNTLGWSQHSVYLQGLQDTSPCPRVAQGAHGRVERNDFALTRWCAGRVRRSCSSPPCTRARFEDRLCFV